MAKKSTTETAKEKLAGAAQSGVDAARDIAGEAIRAAAVAAAGVALQRTAEALRGGARKAEAAVPKVQQPAGPVQGKAAKRAKTTKRAKAKKSTAKSAKKKSAKKKSAKKRRTSRRSYR
jgi:hypothetical protein